MEIKNGQFRDTDNVGHTRHRMMTNHTKQKQNKSKTQHNTTQTTKQMDNMIPNQNTGGCGWTQVLPNDQQFLLLHPPCYSYSLVGQRYMHTNTKNINKTWVILQTTRDKYEPNIVLSGRRSGNLTRNEEPEDIYQDKMNNTNPII